MKIKYLWLTIAFLSLFVLAKTLIARGDEIIGIVMSWKIQYKETEGEIVLSTTKSGYKFIREYNIIYVYMIDGELYNSSVINYMADYSNVDKYLTEYPEGKKIKVYYDSDNPRFSVLEPNKKSYSLFVLPTFLFFIFAFSIFSFISRVIVSPE